MEFLNSQIRVATLIVLDSSNMEIESSRLLTVEDEAMSPPQLGLLGNMIGYKKVELAALASSKQ